MSHLHSVAIGNRQPATARPRTLIANNTTYCLLQPMQYDIKAISILPQYKHYSEEHWTLLEHFTKEIVNILYVLGTKN